MRNKLLLSLVLAAASSSVFAMPYEPMDHCGILEVALTGGGFKASTDNTAYGLTGDFSLANGSGDVLKNDPKYKFGGTVLLGYYFPNSTYNVDLSWTGYRHTDTNSHVGALSPNLIAPALLAVGVLDGASSNYSFDYDFVNLEVGSLTRVNLNGLIINPQLGLSWARLKDHQNVGYASGTALAEASAAEQSSRFQGFGPSFNVDLNYIVCQPITLFGNFRYNALVGDIHSAYRLHVEGAEDISITNGTDATLVSLFQSELGVGYDFNWCDMFCGNIAVGYQLTKAFDVGDQFQFLDGEIPGHFSDHLFNAAIHGWFVRLTMDFDV